MWLEKKVKSFFTLKLVPFDFNDLLISLFLHFSQPSLSFVVLIQQLTCETYSSEGCVISAAKNFARTDG